MGHRRIHALAVCKFSIVLLLFPLVSEEGIHRVVWHLHADEDLVISVILLDALLEEAVEDVPQRLNLIDALHHVHAFLGLPLAVEALSHHGGGFRPTKRASPLMIRRHSCIRGLTRLV